MTTMPIQLFVYGSLKRGFQFSHLMDGADYLGKAETIDSFVLVKYCDYPCLVRSDSPEFNLGSFNPKHTPQVVRGEVYRVKSAEQLRTLDDLEDVPNDYQRDKIRVRMIVVTEDTSANEREVETYIFKRALDLTDANATLLANGEWPLLENQPDSQIYGNETIDPKYLKKS